ncbi:hypothetical protein NG895_06045 [Aeoliella sp. ICT_H6.2]|uniref:Uncharacterized protein n=1 Tax=Aeoliella straminimaris TaxID=2954799 RepID=A0A9X2F8B8_9BACT|nr:hypothetical protein [Aeoliella straminimaris]MCO6043462.1 hypothetical protein [Aeoliella straminimaris]
MQRIAKIAVALLFFVVLCLFGNWGALASQYPLSQVLDDPTPVNFMQFGYSLAIDGERAVVGAPGGCFGCLPGRYPQPEQVIVWDVTTGSVLRTFEGGTDTSGAFGASVAINGFHVLIGAPRNGPYGQRVGRAFLFDSETGDLLHTFDDPTPTDGGDHGNSFDFFGNSVAMDEKYVLIGAPSDDTNGDSVGQAHLFDITTGDLLRTFDDPTPTTVDLFGHSVALDGGRVLIGAPNDQTNGPYVGQAHLFDATTGNLLHTFDDPTVTSRDQFGASVSMDGDRILVGAPYDDTSGPNVGQVHLFDALTGMLIRTFDDPTPYVEDNFGGAVTLEGSNVLVGRWLSRTWPNHNPGELGRRFYSMRPMAVCSMISMIFLKGVQVHGP